MRTKEKEECSVVVRLEIKKVEYFAHHQQLLVAVPGILVRLLLVLLLRVLQSIILTRHCPLRTQNNSRSTSVGRHCCDCSAMCVPGCAQMLYAFVRVMRVCAERCRSHPTMISSTLRVLLLLFFTQAVCCL